MIAVAKALEGIRFAGVHAEVRGRVSRYISALNGRVLIETCISVRNDFKVFFIVNVYRICGA